MYTDENHGQYPDSFQTILLNEDITADAFVCQDTNDQAAQGATTQAVAGNLMSGGHCSYVYLGSGLNSATVPADAVVAYEPVGNHSDTGSNILFGDGHVDWCNAAGMKQMLAKVQQRTGASTMPVTMPAD